MGFGVPQGSYVRDAQGEGPKRPERLLLSKSVGEAASGAYVCWESGLLSRTCNYGMAGVISSPRQSAWPHKWTLRQQNRGGF